MKALVATHQGDGTFSNFDNLVVVNDQPIPQPGAHQVLVKVKATSINPVDWKMAVLGIIISQYPLVLGCDVCGEVVSLGDGVTSCKVGDVIYGFTCLGVPGFGTFAEYCLILDNCCFPLPQGWTPEQACSFPVANFTSFLGCFWHDMLGLNVENGNGLTVLVWGATSSVGMSVIQILAALNYNVIATCSPQFNDYVKQLGASHVFNYRDSNVVEDIRQHTNGQLHYAFDCVGDMKTMQCVSNEGEVRIAYTSVYAVPDGFPQNAKFCAVSLGGIYMRSVEEQNYVFSGGCALIDRLVREGKFHTVDCEIFNGVDQIKPAMERQKGGVSAKKVVVKLE